MQDTLSDKKVVLFGAGYRGRILLEKLIRYGITPAYFVDNSSKPPIMVGYYENGLLDKEIPVYAPDVLLDENKTILKIIITPGRHFFYEIESQLKKMGLEECLIKKPSDSFWACTSLLCDVYASVQSIYTTLQVTYGSYTKQYYDNDFERAFLKSRKFVEYLNLTNFEERYLDFVSGLDEDSISVINQIIDRIHIICSTEGKLDIYTDDEQKILHELKNKFHSQIRRITNTLFYYASYYLPIRNFESQIFYDDYGIKLINNINIEIIKEKDIIDAGGYIGDTALVLSKYTNKNVYVFEPVKSHFNMMLKTLQINKTKNIVPVNCGLGNHKGDTPIYKTEGAGSHYNEVSNLLVDNIEITNMITLDDFVNENNLNVGLIKADIEGFEKEMLSGAIETIKYFKPVLLICIYHNPNDLFEIKPLIESWDLGYSFKIYKSTNQYALIDTILIAEIGINGESRGK